MTNKKIHNLNSELGSARLNTFTIIMVITIMISATIFQDTNEKLEKMAYFFSQLWGCYCCQRFYMQTTGNKRYYKIITDYK